MLRQFASIVLVAAMAFGALAHGAESTIPPEHRFDPNTGANPSKTEYYFVFIPKLVSPFYQLIEGGIKDAVKDYAAKGITIKYDWDAPAQADVVVQMQKMEASAAKRPDALAVSVQDPNVIDPIIRDIQASGVPVATFTDDSTAKDRMAFVGLSGFYDHGVQVGEVLAKAMEYKGEVGMLIGTMSALPHIQRTQGIKDALSKYPDIKVVAEMADEDDYEKGVKLTEQMMNAYPNIRAFTCSDGSATPSISRAVKDANKTSSIIIVGFDNEPETIESLKDGSIFTSMAMDCHGTGYWLVQLMIDAADKKLAQPKEVWIEPVLLTKDNLSQHGY